MKLSNVVVTARPHESFEHLLKRFKGHAGQLGLRKEMIRRRHFDRRVARRKGEGKR